MLLNMEKLYNPTIHLTQTELMEKFNLAFYEGQNLSKSDLLATFDEPDDYLIDYLSSEPQDFDLNDFEQTFNQTYLDLDAPLDLDSIDFTDLDDLALSDDFSNYLRKLPDNSLDYEQEASSSFGHLISDFHETNLENQIVQTQNEALLDLAEEPIFSASLQCLWENCYQVYDTQNALVKHIEKCHVEVKRGEEFTCFWANCPRKVKPFNARYKLLIHMRVHSGEKPNKCPFNGCNKAFSRLENLKIHQRSHTGERPYLCQFPTCSKSFSNSSDRAKHQRTHFDTKPYACQVIGCTKKYTDPSSLRKHVKNHTSEEQMLIKKKSQDECFNLANVRKFFDPNRQKAIKKEPFYGNLEHDYSNCEVKKKYDSTNIKLDLKNKISEKNRLKKGF